MTVRHCMNLVEESDQNKWKISKKEEERLKNEKKLAKCEENGLSENLGKKRAKECNFGKNQAQHHARDSSIKAALHDASHHARDGLFFWAFSIKSDQFWGFFNKIFYTFDKGYEFWRARHDFYSINGNF